MPKTKKMSSLKKGETFRFVGKKKVYQFDGGGPKKGWKYTPHDDILGNGFSTKKDSIVEVDFDY